MDMFHIKRPCNCKALLINIAQKTNFYLTGCSGGFTACISVSISKKDNGSVEAIINLLPLLEENSVTKYVSFSGAVTSALVSRL